MRRMNYAIDSSTAVSRSNDVVYQNIMTLFDQGFHHIYQNASKTYRSTTGFCKNHL